MIVEQKPSRAFENAVLLTLAGGYLDAYTYACRDGVFANAQTGNTVKLGICLANGDFGSCIRFIIPIFAFFLGIFLAVHIEAVLDRKQIHFIRRGILLLEMGIVLAVSFIPQGKGWNMLANALVSLLCAMQMEGFKSFVGQPITTTVATGNLRKFVEFLYQGIQSRDPEQIKAAGYYIFSVLFFCLGAAVGTVVTKKIGISSIRFLLVLYISSFCIISWRRKRMGLPLRG